MTSTATRPGASSAAWGETSPGEPHIPHQEFTPGDQRAPQHPQNGEEAKIERSEDVSMLQFLDPDGNLTIPSGYEEDFAALTPELLRSFYRDMALSRRFDAEGTSLQRQGHLALWVPLRGQEGAQVGVGYAMEPQDFAFPTYREHAVALTRGIDVAKLFDLFRGLKHSGIDPQEHRFHHYTVVLAAQLLHATGYAMGISWDAQREGRDAPGEAVVAFFGDGASSEGDAHEAMVFASSYNAPVLFFNQNNQYAISVPLDVQSKYPLAHRAQGYGFPGERIDGNDVIASYIASSRALKAAREGRGPSLIEAYTYRLSPHTTADDPTKYRTRDEESDWESKEPISRLEKYLRANQLADEDFFQEVQDQAEELAAHVRQYVLTEQSPSFEESMNAVYAEPHPLIDEELAQHRAYEAGYED